MDWASYQGIVRNVVLLSEAQVTACSCSTLDHFTPENDLRRQTILDGWSRSARPWLDTKDCWTICTLFISNQCARAWQHLWKVVAKYLSNMYAISIALLSIDHGIRGRLQILYDTLWRTAMTPASQIATKMSIDWHILYSVFSSIVWSTADCHTTVLAVYIYKFQAQLIFTTTACEQVKKVHPKFLMLFPD